MPLKFWDEAFLAPTFLINRTPSKVINFQTPIERLFSVKPHYSSLCIFGCACWPNLRPYNQHKLEFHSKECMFLGYSNMHKGFKCLDTRTGRIYISRDIIFYEDLFPFSKLHDNAGARLTSEILLLPSTLLPSNSGVVNNGVSVTDFHTSDQLNVVSGDNSNMQHAEINADHTLVLQDASPTSTPTFEGVITCSLLQNKMNLFRQRRLRQMLLYMNRFIRRQKLTRLLRLLLYRVQQLVRQQRLDVQAHG
jgi:hypothetical protein